jgi:hypothetical protein
VTVVELDLDGAMPTKSLTRKKEWGRVVSLADGPLVFRAIRFAIKK